MEMAGGRPNWLPLDPNDPFPRPEQVNSGGQILTMEFSPLTAGTIIKLGS